MTTLHMNCEAVFTKVLFQCIIISLFFTHNTGVDVAAQREKYEPNYSVYHNISQIISDVTDLANQYGSYLIKRDEFKSRNGQTQLFIRISNFTSERMDMSRIKILFAFGEHAREFFPVESMYYFLKNLTGGLDSTSEGSQKRLYSAWVLNNFELFIIGLTNPDGRAYIEQTKNYCWRGTSLGVDLNRNFDWNFGGTGSSNDPSDGEYRGPHAFSEPETDIFRKLIATVSFDAFVSFHSGIRHIYIPYADSKSRQQQKWPENREHILRLAKQMSKSSPGRSFKYGLAFDLNGYTADGTSYDYMAGAAKVPFSLAVELWEHKRHFGRSCFDEFNPRSEHLEREVAMVHPLYVELLSCLYKWKQGEIKLDNPEGQDSVGLVRRKKDDGNSYPRLPQRNDMLYVSQTSEKEDSSASSYSQLMFVLIPLLAVVCLLLMAKHIYSLMRKKRIISLRSLSSTFSMFKTL